MLLDEHMKEPSEALGRGPSAPNAVEGRVPGNVRDSEKRPMLRKRNYWALQGSLAPLSVTAHQLLWQAVLLLPFTGSLEQGTDDGPDQRTT